MTDSKEQRERELVRALEQCASEPVHIPGNIQPHGALLVFDKALRSVLQCSENLREIIGIDPQQLLGSDCLLPDPSLDTLVTHLSTLPLSASVLTRQLLLPLASGERHFHISCWMSDKGLVVELQVAPEAPASRWIDALTHWSSQLEFCDGQDALLQQLTDIVQDLSGYNRVMIYRFDENWNGQVITESLATGSSGYLGHRFPASDIPPQVRQLYRINPVRMILDSEATPSRLLARNTNQEQPPLDLSPGLLRGVSPIHLTYLQNMDVRSSFSIALFSRGELWGLLACHHDSATEVTPSSLQAANLLVKMAAQRRELLERETHARYFQQVLRNRRQLLQETNRTAGQLVAQNSHTWMELFRACGGALIYEYQPLQLWQDTPPESAVRDIIGQLQRVASRQSPWYSNSLSRSELALHDSPEDHAGLLALPLVSALSSNAWLLFFRREQLQLHEWAGPPKTRPSYVNGKPVLWSGQIH